MTLFYFETVLIWGDIIQFFYNMVLFLDDNLFYMTSFSI